MLSRALEIAVTCINESLDDYSPVTIIATVLFLQQAPSLIRATRNVYSEWNTGKIKETLTNYALKKTLQTPFLGPIMKDVVTGYANTALSSFKQEINESRKKANPIYQLPVKGLSVLEIRRLYSAIDEDVEKKIMSGGIYIPLEYPQELSDLLKDIYAKTAFTNPMHPIFKDIKLKEAEVISWCKTLFNGLPGTHGLITASGTVSILEACKTHVFHARKVKGIENPEIIVPSTAHPAFWKAAEILNVKLCVVPVDKKTGKADVKAMKAAITPNTCLIVGSAPSFPFGVIDPIQELANIAYHHQNSFSINKPIPFHVDSCLGGFLTAFARKAGFNQSPICDFSIQGVTSISADIHKYAEGPKGASIVMFHPNSRTPTHTFLTSSVGAYITPGIPGSRTGEQIATAHAVLAYHGEEGYVLHTKNILELTQTLVHEIKKIKGIILPYSSQLSVIGMRTVPGINPWLVAEKMKEKGIELNMLLTEDYQPDGFHFCLTMRHVHTMGFVDRFVDALDDACEYVRRHPHEKPKGMAKAYGILATGFVPSLVQDLIGETYVKIDQSLPQQPLKTPGFRH